VPLSNGAAKRQVSIEQGQLIRLLAALKAAMVH
jgi:hypothetical protein